MTIIIPRGTQMTTVLDSTVNDIIILLEPSSLATITLSSNSHTRNATIQRKIHCILHEQSSLTFHYDESWDESVTAKTELLIEQKAFSMLYYKHSAKGGAQIFQQFSLKALEPHAHADMKGIYQVAGQGSVTMTTLQYHDAKHAVSNLRIKGIIRDAGRMDHHGTIRITECGGHTESAQHTQLLLLSDQARAVSVPNIEVLTHEVQCGHGSAIGRLDEEQLWYLQARGLSPSKAEELLIDGFLNF